MAEIHFKEKRKFMHIHVFDISFRLVLNRLFYSFFHNVCQKRVFLLLPANSREQGERCWSHKRGTQCRGLVKSLSTLPRRWGATTTLRKRPYVHFEKKKRRRGFVIRHVGARYRLAIKNLGLLLKIEFL